MINHAEPINNQSFETLLGVKLQCSAGGPSRVDCNAKDVPFANVKIGYVDLRANGSNDPFLVLHDLSGQCVDIQKLEAKYGKSTTISSCTDGAICWYRFYQLSRSTIAVGTGNDMYAACAKEVVFNLRR